jgi:excisionase family DNA binding protein
MYGVEELARLLGVSKTAIYAGLKSGVIPGIRLGKRWLLSRAAIGEWLKGRPAGAVA